jgi:hypothetical protein
VDKKMDFSSWRLRWTPTWPFRSSCPLPFMVQGAMSCPSLLPCHPTERSRAEVGSVRSREVCQLLGTACFACKKQGGRGGGRGGLSPSLAADRLARRDGPVASKARTFCNVQAKKFQKETFCSVQPIRGGRGFPLWAASGVSGGPPQCWLLWRPGQRDWGLGGDRKRGPGSGQHQIWRHSKPRISGQAGTELCDDSPSSPAGYLGYRGQF